MEKREQISLNKLFWYFILFSIAGLVVETAFCFSTTGNIESRKGFIWGPFCPIYGVGAVILILLLDRYKNSSIKVFLIGFVAGNVIEYIISFILEAMYGIRFWEYSYLDFNLNGRICILFGIFWGVLSMLLMRLLRPFIDGIINKISKKITKPIEMALFIFLVIDMSATIWGMNVYKKRAYNRYYNIQTNIEKYSSMERIKYKIEEVLFSDEYMVKTFPNVRMKDNQGNELFIKDIIM